MANKSFSNVKVKVTHLDLSKDTSRSVLVSGENISHSLGKIARWYKDIAWTGHTHTKSQITDFAHTHTSLDSSVDKGAENQPVYFVKGVPTAIAYTIKSSVPENAVFTDTKVTAVGNHYTPSGGTTTAASGGTLTDITNSANGIQVLTGVTKDAAGHVTGVTSIALKSVNSNTTYAAGTGISMGTGNVINHSNSITAVTTAAFKKFKYDAQGHITGTAAVTASDLPSHTHSYLPLSGGTMTGMLTLQANQYTDNYTTGGMDCKNSNIIGINSLVFADLADSAGEGLQFYRTATTVDSIWVKNGVMYFTPNRTLGSTATDYTIYHSGNLTLSTLGAAAASHTHGLLHDSHSVSVDSTTNTWKAIGINGTGYVLKSIRTNTNAPAYLLNDFSAGIAFGGVDTRGVISMSYNQPQMRFAGGNRTAQVDEEGNPNGTAVWYFTLKATHNQTYTLPSTGGTLALVGDNNHSHAYLPTAGGTMTGDITFTGVTSTTYPASSKAIKFSGSTDGANIFYRVNASDQGELVIQTIDDSNCYVKIESSHASAKNTIKFDPYNSYIYANYFNASCGAETPTTSSYIIYANSDGWIRKSTLANVKTILGLGSAAYTASTAYAASSHTHSYAKSESVNGPAYSVAGTQGTTEAYRHVWFSVDSDDTRRAYADNFKYEPALDTLKFGAWYPVDITGQTVNLNDYTDGSGKRGYRRYICKTSVGGANISNKPSDSPFVLEVILIRFATVSTDFIAKQIYHSYNKKTYQRFCVNNTWDAWSEIKTTDTVYTHPSHTAASSGLYKITVNSLGHVTAATAVTKADITALGIPGSDTNTNDAVTQSATTTTNYRPILTGATNVGTSGTGLDATITSQAYVSNMLFVQPSTGRLYARNLVAYNVDGGDVIVEWNRSGNASWRMLNTGGNLYLQCNYTTAKTDYYSAAKFNYNKGAVELYTGTLQIGNSDKASAGISFKTTNYTGAYLRVYDTGTAYNHDVVLNSTGSVMIGAGESASAVYDNNIESIKNSENMALSADGNIFIYTGANTINARKRFKLTQGGNFGFTGMTGDWKRYCYWDGATGGTDSSALAPTSGLMRAGVWGYTSSIYTYFITGSDINEHYFTANTYGIFAGCGSPGGAGGGDASTLTKRAGVVGVHNGKDAFYACIAAPSSLSNYVTCTLPNTSGTLALEGHTHSYLPLSGGKLTGALKIQTGSTNANVTYNDTVNPRLTFSNSNDSQYISLVYSDYDSYQAPDSLTLIGNQSGSYFIAPNIKATSSFYGSLSGNATTATTAKRLKYCTLCNESANAATYPWYRMAYAYSAGTYTDFNLVMMVTYGYGSKWGIFKARARTEGTAGTFGSAVTIEWIVKHGFSNEQLYLLTKNNYQVDTAKSGTATVEIWFKSDGRYSGYTFTVLHEGWRTGTTSDLWALSSYTTDGAESYNKNVSSAKVSTSPSILAKTLKTATAVSNTGWTNNTTDDNIIPTMSFMAFWNGRYNSSSSSLQYCNRGAFGTIVTAGVGDYVKISKVLWTGTVATTARGEKSYTLANKATGYNIIKILYTSSTMTGGAAGCLEINGTKTAIPQPVVVGASATSTMQFYFKISSDGATITVGSNDQVITITGIYGLII